MAQAVARFYVGALDITTGGTMRISRSLTVLGAALIIGISGVAATAIAAPGNQAPPVINACVAKNNGGVRIVGPDQPCGKSESALQWNQQGVPGVDGKDGAAGQDASSVKTYYANNVENLIPPTSQVRYIVSRCDLGDSVISGIYTYDTGGVVQGLSVASGIDDSSGNPRQGWVIRVSVDAPTTLGEVGMNAVCLDNAPPFDH